MTAPQVRVVFTRTAADALRALPDPARRGLLARARKLADSGDPAAGAKRLSGELHALFSLMHSRYRMLYAVHEETDDAGRRVFTATMHVLLVGTRRDGHKKDVYELARKLIRTGVIDLDTLRATPLTPDPPPRPSR